MEKDFPRVPGVGVLDSWGDQGSMGLGLQAQVGQPLGSLRSGQHPLENAIGQKILPDKM